MRALAAARSSASSPSSWMWPSSVFGTRRPSTNSPEPIPVPNVRTITTPPRPLARAERHLRHTRRIRVVDDGDVTAGGLREERVDVGADPRLVDVGRAVHHTVAHHGWHRGPDRTGPVEVLDELLDDERHRLRRRRLRGVDAEALVARNHRSRSRPAPPSCPSHRCRCRSRSCRRSRSSRPPRYQAASSAQGRRVRRSSGSASASARSATRIVRPAAPGVDESTRLPITCSVMPGDCVGADREAQAGAHQPRVADQEREPPAGAQEAVEALADLMVVLAPAPCRGRRGTGRRRASPTRGRSRCPRRSSG